MALIDNCDAYYKMDGDATDATGNGNDGTVTGATLTTGKINQGYSFDGGDIIKFPSLGLTGSMSFSYWVNTTSTTASKWQFNLYSEANYGALTNSTGTGLIIFHLLSNSSRVDLFIPNSVIFDGNWHLVTSVVDIDNNLLKVYLDGVLYASSSNSGLSLKTRSEANNAIGGSISTGGITGVMDETGIWDRALTEAEVTELYNSGDGLQYPFDATRKAFPLFWGQGR